MQNGQNLPRHFDVILGHVDRFETDQKALTPAPAGTAAPTGPATALASPGTSQTELIRVFYAVLYPDFTHTGQILANCRDVRNHFPLVDLSTKYGWIYMKQTQNDNLSTIAGLRYKILRVDVDLLVCLL